MFKLHILLYLIYILSFAWLPEGAASDLTKEQRWSEQIVDSLLVGKAVELKAGETAFLGVFAEASEGPGDSAVILLHGMGVHPDWPEVIHPLRSQLPEQGWATLSIQMPVLANDATLADYEPLFAEVGPRIDAAVAYLQGKNYRTQVLIGHSLGASMAATYLAGGGQKNIKGLVAIGLAVLEQSDKMNSGIALEKISLPVLDLYGTRDLDLVLSTAKARAKAARTAGNPAYRQIQIEGADHFFLGMDDTLNRRVYGWLKSQFDKPPEGS